MSDIGCFLFDFDGTIVDSETFHFESSREMLLKSTGKEMSHAYYMEKLAGVPMSLSSPNVIKDFGLEVTVEELVHSFDSHTRERYKTNEVGYMPGADNMIAYVQSLDTKTAIVTGSGRRDVALTVDRLGLTNTFETMITHDDVVNVKPHPEPYERAVKALGVQKEECVVFEDSQTGTASAKAAGLTVFAIQKDPIMANKLQEADKLFQDFNQVLEWFRHNS